MRGDEGVPVRLRFSKRGPVRFISHRDVARAFERAFRIAELPLAFSRGFSPHPKVSFGPALAVGYESDAEYLDVELTRTVDLERLVPTITDGLPEGMDVTGAAPLVDRAPSLQESIGVLGYRVELAGIDPPALGAAVAELVVRDRLEVPVTRKGEERIDDIRPSVLALAQPRPDEAVVVVEIATRPRTLRVVDVVSGLRAVSPDAATLAEQRVVRTHQWIERGGARHEPLDVDRRSAAPAGAQTRALEACA
ncbi:MAG: TIGR03936 family radical SAM-associated protein [Actinomycetota bacterium]